MAGPLGGEAAGLRALYGLLGRFAGLSLTAGGLSSGEGARLGLAGERLALGLALGLRLARCLAFTLRASVKLVVY